MANNIIATSTTDILHAIPVDPLTGSISVPIYQTATFVQDAPGVHKGFDYGRSNNPTRTMLENLCAKLEGGYGSLAFATGLAAIDAVLKLLKTGDEIIAVDDIYGGAFRLFTHVYEKFGIKIHYVDTTDAENIEPYLNERTKLIWIETPTNPTLKITDIKQVAVYKNAVDALLVVDNTFASPIGQNPFDFGADIIIHSATKYLGGHSDLLAGIVILKEQDLYDKIKFIQNASGGILGPQDAWLLIKGIETLELRFKQQCETALQVATFLTTHPAVDQVYYPGLSHHKNHGIAAAQQRGLFGGVIAFTLKEDTTDAAIAVTTQTKYFKLAESLGGVKSLLCVPAEMTHKSVPREKRLSSGVADSLIRLSCGIELAQDLIGDIDNALQHALQPKVSTVNTEIIS